MKKNIFILFLTFSTLLSINSANADDTYAMLDSQGNVTNIIVCGSACASGEFAGQRVVPQVAADPVTGENRGGFWQGPGTTTYDSQSKTFTMVDNSVVTRSFTEAEDGTQITSSTTIYGGKSTSFKYQDTIGSNLFTRNGFIQGYLENTKASVSVNKNNITESLDFDSRKTKSEIVESIKDSNLSLLNSKVQTLISLLDSWVK